MSIKHLFIIILCFSISPTVFTQTRKLVVKQPNKQTATFKWNNVAFEKGGVKSLSLPMGLVKEEDSDYDKTWKKSSAKSNIDVDEVDLNVTIWDEGFKVPDLKPELATPENMIALDLMGDMREVAASKNGKAAYYKVDGINGTLVQKKWMSDKRDQMIFIWGTYRYYMKTKAERIVITVIVPKTKPQNAMKIINSLKIEKDSD